MKNENETKIQMAIDELNHKEREIAKLQKRIEMMNDNAHEAIRVLDVLILADKLDRNDLEHAQDFVNRPRGIID